MAEQVKTQYEVVTGLNYPGKGGKDVRREPGEKVSDIPKQSIEWLLADGHIKEVK